MSKQKQFSFKPLHYPILLVLLALAFSACNIGHWDPLPPEPPTVKVSSLAIRVTDLPDNCVAIREAKLTLTDPSGKSATQLWESCAPTPVAFNFTESGCYKFCVESTGNDGSKFSYSGSFPLDLKDRYTVEVSFVKGVIKVEFKKVTPQPVKGWKISEMEDSALLNSDEVSLAISPTGEPALVYSINTNKRSNIIYRERKKGSWSVQTVDISGSYKGNRCTLAYNSAGQPMVGYNGTHPQAYYPMNALKVLVNGEWTINPLALTMYGIEAPTAVGDSKGRVHTLYNFYPNKHGIVYFTYSLLDSKYNRIENNKLTGKGVALAVDSLDNATYIYYRTAEYDGGPKPPSFATYKSIENGKPVEELMKSIPSGYSSISLAIDSKDMRAIAYYNYQESRLYFAKRVNGEWQKELVDEKSFTYGNCSLAFDSSDRAVIAFYDKTERSLKVARQSATGWEIKTLDSNGDVGSACTIKAGEKGYLAIAYADDVRKKVKLAEYR